MVQTVFNGDVVYQARALYDVVFDTLVLFDDEGCDTGGIPTMWRQANPTNKPVNSTQQYHLYPNPASGLYLLKLVDSSGNRFTFKFTVD